MSRRGARLAAVEVLYGADVRGGDPRDLLAEREGCDVYSAHLVEVAGRRRSELDEIIRRHAIGWSPERMSVVDRNILRVGVLELLEDEVPAAAVIDEAVEIAKRLSGEEAARFVNGVLEAVRQELAGGDGADGGDGGDGGSVSRGGSGGG